MTDLDMFLLEIITETIMVTVEENETIVEINGEVVQNDAQ